MKRLLSSTLARVVFAVLLTLFAIVVIAATVLTIAEGRAERRLATTAEAHGFDVTWKDLTLKPWGEVILDEVEVQRDGVTIAKFEQLEVDVRLLSRRVFSVRPVVESIGAKNGFVAPASAMLPGALSTDLDDATEDEETDGGLRELFGGEPPDFTFEGVTVETGHLGGPARNITIVEFETERDGRSWTGKGRVSMESQSDDVVLPEHASVEATFLQTDEGWKQGPLEVTFDTPAAVKVQGREITTRAMEIDSEGKIRLREVTVSPFALGTSVEADAVEVSPMRAVLNRNIDDIEELRIERPRVEISGEILSLAMQSLPSQDAEAEAGAENVASWNARLDRAWDKAFRLSERALEKLDERLPPTLVVDEATVALTVPDSSTRVTLENLDVLFMGGDDNPRLSVRTQAVVAGEPVGKFSFLSSGGETRKITVRAENLDANLLQSQLARLGPWPSTTTISGAVDVELEATHDPSGIHPFAGSVATRDFTLNEPRLAQDPVVVKRASYQFEGRHAPDARVAEPSILPHRTGYATIPDGQRRGAIEIDRGILKVGEVGAEFTFDVYGLAALPEHLPARLDVQFDLPPTDVRALWEAVPEAIRGPIAEAKLRGEFSWAFDAEFPLHNASATRWRSAPVVEDFRIVDLPHEVDVRRMLRSMEVTIRDRELDFEKTVLIPAPRSERDPRGDTPRPPWESADLSEGPCGEYVYVPLDYISSHLRSGVLTTEDGLFFSHEGFNVSAIKSSMERNLEEGEFVRGASTISMQLVKNLFLSGRKTLARKVQEAFLVWVMESVVRVPKSRILEIYFNIIEYGPAVYGIHHASLYYFGKRPDDLSVNEVGWFISTLPGPKLYHRYYDRGWVSDYWWSHIQGYLDTMYRRGRLDEYELLTAKAERPRFRNSDTACEPGAGLNNPHRQAAEIEPLRRVMHNLRVVQDRNRSDVLDYAENWEPPQVVEPEAPGAPVTSP